MPLYIDSHIHTSARTQDEMAAMKAAGVVAVVEPAYWRAELQGQDHNLRDYFNRLVGWERFRASQSDLCHYCTVGLPAHETNNPQMVEQAMAALPLYAANESVVAIGEMGFESMVESEEHMFRFQLRLAKQHGLPVLIRSSQDNKQEALLLAMRLCEEEGMSSHQVIVSLCDEEMVSQVLERGYWCALSLCSVNGMSCETLVVTVGRHRGERIMVSSAAAWGWGHPLAVPGIADLMEQRGLPAEIIRAACYENALKAYSSSGRMSEADWLAMPSDAVNPQHGEAPAFPGTETDIPALLSLR